MKGPESGRRHPRTDGTRSELDRGDLFPRSLGGTPNGTMPGHSRTMQCWLVCMCIWVSAVCLPARGQYTLDWFTVDGGGGMSTGGLYSVVGTIGQPAAGAISGGNYSLTDGFWAFYAVQTPGAPKLSIFLSDTNTVVIVWPSPSAGWELQLNTNNVGSLNWSNVAGSIHDDGTTKTFTLSPPTGMGLYRLHKP